VIRSHLDSSAGRLVVLAGLYLSQGLPFGFFTQALPALLRERGYSLTAIGATWLLGLPWALKFAWAPLVDRLGSSRFGRRKSWIVPLQLLTAGAMLLLAQLGLDGSVVIPATSLAAAVFMINLLSATQDIATDGLAVDLLPPGERGVGNGVQVAGHRLGMVVGGGVLLIAYAQLGWRATMSVMALVLVVATVPLLLLREPERHQARAPSPALVSFARRPGAARWLLAIGAYKSGDALVSAVLRPMLVDRGLDLADIGWLLGTAGFVASLGGGLVGGTFAGRLPRERAVLWCGAVQAVAVALCLMPAGGMGGAALGGIVVFEHFASGMATAAVFTVMMDVCRAESAAADYTVQASLLVVVTGGMAIVAGLTADTLGYVGHVALAAVLGVAGVAVLQRAMVRAWLPVAAGTVYGGPRS
jgi:MFS transporter, PAT family, beta-lactamase induction signal transducer AmpG